MHSLPKAFPENINKTYKLGVPTFLVSVQILMPKLVNLGRFKVCIY